MAFMSFFKFLFYLFQRRAPPMRTVRRAVCASSGCACVASLTTVPAAASPCVARTAAATPATVSCTVPRASWASTSALTTRHSACKGVSLVLFDDESRFEKLPFLQKTNFFRVGLGGVSPSQHGSSG